VNVIENNGEESERLLLDIIFKESVLKIRKRQSCFSIFLFLFIDWKKNNFLQSDFFFNFFYFSLKKA